MKVEDIKANTLIYSAPYKSMDPADNCLQIYNIKTIKPLVYPRSYELELITIIGPYDFDISIPLEYDLNDLILIKHNFHTFMVYSTNEDKIVNYYNNYINNKQFDFQKYWDEYDCRWHSLDEEE